MNMTIPADVIRLDTIKSKLLTWLWKFRIAFGKLGLLVGPPDRGKTLLFCDWTARITNGSPWPDGAPCPKGRVLFLEAEDGLEDTIVPRLQAAGAKLSDVVTWKQRDLKDLKACITAEGITAVFISPLNTYLPAINTWKDADVRRVLQPLVDTAQDTGAAIVGIMHPPKNQSLTGLSQVPDSVAYGAVARSVLFVDKHEDGYILETRKRNLAPSGVPSLTYSINESPEGIPYIVWGSSLSSDYRPPVPPRPDDAPIFDAACDFLIEWLGDGQKIEVKKIMTEARKRGIGGSTMYRAANHLHVEMKQGGQGAVHGSYWSFPKDSPFLRPDSSVSLSA